MAEETAQGQNWRVAKVLITVWVSLFMFGLYLMIFR
jgi:hypothetical protein